MSFIVHREIIEEPNHEYEDANRSGAENPTGSAVDLTIQDRHVKIYDVFRTFQPERYILATEKHHECASHVSTTSVVGCHNGAHINEGVLNVNNESVAGYQEVPNIPILDYERALDYERVPDVNLAQILSTAGIYQTYECSPAEERAYLAEPRNGVHSLFYCTNMFSI